MFTWKHINRTASNIQLSSCTWNSSRKLGVLLPPSFINATPSKTDHHQHDINAISSKTDHHQHDIDATPSKTDHHQHDINATPSKTNHHQHDTNATPSKTDHHQHEKLGNFQTPNNSWQLMTPCQRCWLQHLWKEGTFCHSLYVKSKTHKANKLLDRCIFRFLLLCYYYCCCFTKSNQYSVINGHKVRTVKDGENSQSFIHLNVVRKLSIPITKRTGHVLMASASLTSKNLGYAYITFNLNSPVHNNVKNIGTR